MKVPLTHDGIRSTLYAFAFVRSCDPERSLGVERHKDAERRSARVGLEFDDAAMVSDHLGD